MNKLINYHFKLYGLPECISFRLTNYFYYHPGFCSSAPDFITSDCGIGHRYW